MFSDPLRGWNRAVNKTKSLDDTLPRKANKMVKAYLRPGFRISRPKRLKRSFGDKVNQQNHTHYKVSFHDFHS